ncbi:unnamed protein product [Rotaria sordida]|uniref:Potassium channel domain-containing protein n=1 Tax=Rotaria sordida TaxID=392033 RepID=A0A813QPB5_9BILA|nr:unnamed protein product [Rotaria sordida]
MPKKFSIREWVLSVKYWSLLFIPHIAICLIFLIYILIGASIIQEIETDYQETSSSTKALLREQLISNIVEKRQTFDIEQYTKYVSEHISLYEEEIKNKRNDFEENLSWNFSKFLFFIVTTLTTIGSNEFIPQTKLGKLFLIIYTGFGIPLTLVFLINLSYLIKRIIKHISLIIFHFYTSRNFLHIRRLFVFRPIDKQLNILFEENIEEEDLNLLKSSSTIQQYINNILNILKNINDDNDLTLKQLILTIFIYILIGTYFIPSNSLFDSFYLCFTTIFTINLNNIINQENNLFFIIIYLIIGLAIVLLSVKTIKIRLENLLVNIGKILFKNLLEFSQQIGSHDLNTDDFLADNDIKSNPVSEHVFSQHRYITNITSLQPSSANRPICIAEPLRRLSTDFIRVLKNNDSNDEKNLHKSVQVNTMIRRCDRCAESPLSSLPLRKNSLFSTSSSSMTDNSSSCDDDDTMEFPPPNLDQIRKRRATLVAKTIINQMATQPRLSSIDESVSPSGLTPKQRHRSSILQPVSVRCSVKVSRSPSVESTCKCENNQKEFTEISKQISSLLISHDD